MTDNPQCAVFACATQYLATASSYTLDPLRAAHHLGPCSFSQNMARLKPMNALRGRLIADQYAALAHDPAQLETQASYDQLAREICAQYEALMHDFRLDLEPWLGEDEPYRGSPEMLADVGQHRHLYFYPTATAFGEAAALEGNPLLASTDVRIRGHPCCINDLFRIVHDVFGHFLNQAGFGPLGEERAWFAHWHLFSDLARPALTTETRGQNSWFNYGPHLRLADGRMPTRGDPGWIPPVDRPFAEQKVGLLPPESTGVEFVVRGTKVVARSRAGWTPHLEDFAVPIRGA